MRFAVVLLAFAVLCGCGERSSFVDTGSKDPEADGGFVAAMVLARLVIDGDTIIVGAGAELETPDGQSLDDERIRLIGVDTPEVEKMDGTPAECFGDEAKAFTEQEIGGRIIELTYDVSNGIRDDFGRLLAYVERNGKVHNEELLRTGHAKAFRAFPHRDSAQYIALESDARNADLGLWGCP